MTNENTNIEVVEAPKAEKSVNAAPTGDRKPFNKDNNRGDRKGGNGPRKFEKKDDGFEERVVTIRRVTKVTKGGRHFRFAAVVVVGNKKGQVGLGTGKANEVPDAIKKAVKEARKNLVTVKLRGTTVPHEILGQYGAGQVLIKPAKPGTGVIAGGPSRAVIELAGIQDIYAKSLGRNTPINMIRATIDGLEKMQTARRVQELRFGKTFEKAATPKPEVKPAAKKEAAAK